LSKHILKKLKCTIHVLRLGEKLPWGRKKERKKERKKKKRERKEKKKKERVLGHKIGTFI